MNEPRHRWFLPLFLIVAIGCVHLSLQRDGHSWGGDFSQYIQHAHNLASGVAYENSGYVYNKHESVVGPPTYPPGCPAILAPVYAVSGLNLTSLKIVMAVSFVAALFFMYLNVRGELRWTLVCVFLGVVGLNHYYLEASNEIASDLPFLAFLFLTLWLAQKAYARGEGNCPHLPLMLATGLAVYAAFAVRTVGGVLLPTLWVFEIIRSRRISKPLLVATGLFASLMLLHETLLHSDNHYLDQFGNDVVAHLINSLQNTALYLRRTVAFWHNGYSNMAAGVVFLMATAFAGAGYWSRVRQGLTVCEVFPWMYLPVVFIFPAYQGERFLFPVLPLYVFYIFCGIERLLEMRPVFVRRLAVCGFLLAVTGSYAARYTTLERGPLPEGVHTPEAKALFQFVATSMPENETVVFVKPRVMALYTGRRSTTYHVPQDDRELWDYLTQNQAGCLVTVERDEALTTTWSEDPGRLDYLRRFVQRHSNRLECVYSSPDFRVWRVRQMNVLALQ